MLLDLCIENLALIERAALSFGSGLNAITGETGAGKSLLVGALELLLGERPRGAPADWVRQGSEHALVEGRFAVPSGPLRARVDAWLAENLPELAPDSNGRDRSGVDEAEFILGRRIGRDGRTRAHVNHRPVTAKHLRELGALLVEIHGQHDDQTLFEPAEQLRLLDAYGELAPALARYRERRQSWRALARELQDRERIAVERAERLELLRYQSGELAALRLEAGEVSRLRAERALLRGAEQLGTELGRAAEELADAEDSALDRIKRAARALERWQGEIDALRAPSEALQASIVHLEDALGRLASFASGVEADPARLEAVESRLAEIERLERVHRAGDVPRPQGAGGGDGLLERAAEIGRELAELERAAEDAGTLERRTAAARAELETAARELSRARAALRPKLARAVQSVLAELGLERARFDVTLTPAADGGEPTIEADLTRFGPDGADRVEFALGANPGEPLRPLRHVASGGEAARILLALRSVLSAGDAGKVLVFDEIDAGVGGRLGPKVGAHLRRLAADHQVLCVTHLPAIAALAHVHLAVAKDVARQRTRTEVRALSGDARVAELADMIAGGRHEPTARAEAQRLLESAR